MAKPIIVRPFLDGWGIEDRREWRGPYYSQELAVEVAMAELRRRHPIVPDLRLLVLRRDGTVLLDWPDAAAVNDVVMVESSPELPPEAAPASAPPMPGGLRDWRSDPRRYYR